MRIPALPIAIAASIAVNACSGGDGRPAPRTCSADDQCGNGWCVRGACVADAAPDVQITPPATVRASSVAEFGATVSDADPDDGVASVRWSVTPVADGCDAELEETSTERLRAIFWCAGTYELELVAVDQRGTEGTSGPVRVVVEPSPSAPVAGAAAPLSAPHRCAGEPLACDVLTPAGAPLRLAASAVDPDGGALEYAWTVTPPAGSDAVVVFDPSPDVRDPVVRISSSSGALGGDWRFRVRVRDPEGLLAQAVQVVTVENAPPSLPTEPLAAPHAYVAPLFIAEAQLRIVATDPEGDPIRVELSYAEPDGTGCTSALTPAGEGSALRVACEAAASLIGAVERKVQVVATDASGARTTVALPVVVQNRAPVVATRTGAASISAPHTVKPCAAGTCFVAEGEDPFVVTDPDGDPVTPVSLELVVKPALTHSWSEAAVSGGGSPTFAFGTPLAFPSEFRAYDGFRVIGRASDPWTTGELSAEVAVLNRPPTPPASVNLAAAHSYSSTFQAYTAAFPLPTVTDPDGDPVTFSGASGVCAAVGGRIECSVPFAWAAGGATPLPGFLGSHSITVTASDPWDGSTFGASVEVANGAPSVTCAASTTNACTCRCSKWIGDACMGGQLVFVPGTRTVARVSDPNSDPVGVTASGSATITSAANCGPGCAVTANVPGAGTYTFNVAANDGVASSGTTACAVSFSCGGGSCTL